MATETREANGDAAVSSAKSLVLAEDVDSSSRTGLVYNSLMLLHCHPTEAHPEAPLRIAHIFHLLKTSGYLVKLKRVKSREATLSEIRSVHTEAVVQGVYNSARLPLSLLEEQAPSLERDSSLYLNQYSAVCARLSAGSLVEMCDAVVSGRIRNGFALIRPPGHHAEPNRSMGFCLFNNVAIGVRTMQNRYPAGDRAVKRVMILDWDVHHGNGTQAVFNDDPSVLYVSLHRYDDGTFYPGGPFGSAESVGVGSGRGYSVNISWPTYGMGDGDYLAAFDRVILPIAQEYGPDLVIVSAGFDAAKGDPLGLNVVTPTGYAHMTGRLAQLAGGRLVVALEGGYNVDSIAPSALAVVRVLLGEAPPVLPPKSIACPTARRTLAKVRKVHARFWTNLADPYAMVYDTEREDIKSSSSGMPAEHVAKRPRLTGPTERLPDWLRNPALSISATDADLLRLWREKVYWEHHQLTPFPLSSAVPRLDNFKDSGTAVASAATSTGVNTDSPVDATADASTWTVPATGVETSRRKRTLPVMPASPLVHAMLPFDFFTSARGMPSDPCGSGVGHSHAPQTGPNGHYRAVMLYVHDVGAYRSGATQDSGVPLSGTGGWNHATLPAFEDASRGYMSLHSWARAKKVAVVDVCVLVAPVLSAPSPMRPHSESYTGLKKDLAAEIVRLGPAADVPVKSIQDSVTLAAIAAWDGSLSLLPSCPRILVGGGSAGIDAVMGVLAARGTENVRAVVQLAGMGALPHTPGGLTIAAHLPQRPGISHTDHILAGRLEADALKEFYHKHSLVLVPREHPASGLPLGARYGNIVNSSSASPHCSADELPRIAHFLDQQLGWDLPEEAPASPTPIAKSTDAVFEASGAQLGAGPDAPAISSAPIDSGNSPRDVDITLGSALGQTQ